MPKRTHPVAGLTAIASAAALVLVYAWHGTAVTAQVPFQLPWLMSAALGLGLAAMVLGGWSIHLARREESETRDQMQAVMDMVVEECRSGLEKGRT